MKKDRCMLITGTIVPNSNYVAVSDPAQRLNEYTNTLQFYASSCDLPVFFLENSKYDIASDKAFARLLKDSGITLLRFPPSPEWARGKGYQEFEMIDKAVEQLAPAYESFVKITGRQHVLNIRKLSLLHCDNIIIDRYGDLRLALTNIFIVRTDFYKSHIKGAYLDMDDSKGIFAEHVIYRVLGKHQKSVSLFPYSPRIRGISGSYGLPLGGNRIKCALRNTERKMLSLFGINEFPKKY